MIEGAEHSASILGIRSTFLVMDAENPVFEPESFDAIVTRNLTSFLPNLPEAYKRWHGLLKKGGILINFDGDYHHDHPSTPLPENHAHKELTAAQNEAYAHIESQMLKLQKPRPAWDIALLERAGFREIRVDRECWQRIYREIDQFYNPTPIFCVTAKK